MATFEELKEQVRQQRNSETSGTSASFEALKEQVRRQRFEEDVRKVDNDYINLFTGAANDYFSSAQSDYDKLDWGSAGNAYTSRESTKKDLDYRQSVIRAWLDRQRWSLGEETYKGISDTLDAYNEGAASILEAFGGARDYFSRWDTEDDYLLYANLPSGAERFQNFDKKTADSGWRAYLSDRSKPQEEKSWAERVTEYLGGIPADTSQIAMQFDIAKDQYAMDTSWQEPDDRWADWMKENFGYLYATDPEAAKRFAAEINDALNKRERTGYEDTVLEGATRDLKSGALHTAGALMTAPFGIADYLDTVAEYAGRGRISEKAYITPFGYSQTVTGGIAKNLNDQYGTLDEKIPVIGGKGWGDVYGLGTSIAQSSLAAATGGQLGTLIQFFGSAAASGVEEAKNRGATDEQALLLGTLNGLAEGLAEQAGVDNLLKVGASHTWREFAVNLLKQGGAEGMEEGLTTLMNNIADQIVMQDDSIFYTLVDNYMADGMDVEAAKKQAWLDMVNDIAFDMLGGFVSGAVHAGPQTAYETYRTGREMRTAYGDHQQELVEEGLESPEGTHSRDLGQRYQEKLDAGRSLSGSDLYRLVNANTSQAAAERLTELGETGDVQAIGEAIADRIAGKPLTRAQNRLLSGNQNAQTVLREMNTGRVTEQEAQEPARAENRQPVQAMAQPVQAMAQPENVAQKATAQSQTETVRENRTADNKETVAANDRQVTGKLTQQERKQETAEESSANQEETSPASIEEASRAYGAQAGAMLHTYHQGQDVEQYDRAYRAAFDMGRSGVSLNYVKNSSMTAYLTDGQKELAHRTGAAAAKAEAEVQDRGNRTAANGKQGHRQGTVKGEGVTIEDLRKGFNDQQGRAYQYLASVAEATGVDIVLYKSEVSEADGKYQGAQGRFVWDENKIYIDVNAGLSYARDAGEAAKYAMLRTFGHEFTHFIEKWNPVQYNDFREAVLNTLEERGENVNDLIEEKMALDESGKVTYEEASREVVAEAMTDILPDSNFVQELAERNKTVFQKLLEKLKEFTENLRSYFQSLGSNRSREANALKEQVGDTIKYLDSIVKLFDEAAVEAVENYQQGADDSGENRTDIQNQSREQADTRSTNPYDGKSLYGSEEIYSYEFMSSQKDMEVIELPSLTEVKTGQKVDQKKAVEMGLKNAESIGREVGKNQYAIRNAYTGRDIIVGTSGLSHSLTGDNVNRLRTNARLSAVGGEIVQNAIPVNGLKNKNRQASGTYAMACLLSSGDYHIVAIVTVEEYTSKAVGIDYVDIAHSINGRIKAKNIDSRSSTREMGNGQQSAPTTATYNVSISDFLGIVNDTHKSILSEDVLNHFEEKRPETGYYTDKVLYQQRTDTLTDREVLRMASEKLREGNLTKAEQDALDIFDRRVSRLEALQQEREQQGKLYHEQQFGKKPDREQAAKTRNRMKLLDDQIQRAGNEILEVEDKNILRKLLQKGKQVVEQQERARSQQVLQNYRKNRAESMDKTAMRQKVQKVVKELNDLLLNESKKRHVPDRLKKAVAEALDLVNMDTVGAEERARKYRDMIEKEQAKGNPDQNKIDAYTVAMENILRQGEKMGDRLRALKSAYEDIQNSDDPDIANAYDPVIAGSLQELAQSIGNTALKDMTMAQLSDVYDMYRMVLTRVQDSNKAFAKGRNETIREMADKTVREIRNTGGSQKMRASILDPVKAFLWNNLKPVYAIELMGSKTLIDAFDRVRAGEDTWATDVTEARNYYMDKVKEYHYNDWDFKKKYSFEATDGNPFELTLGQILSLYAYSRRDQALDHLRLGGFVFDSNIETYKEGKSKLVKYKVNTAEAHQINPETLATITGALTEEQKRFAEDMQDYLSKGMGAKGNEVTMEMYGVKLFKEKHYFPLKSARQYLFEQNEVAGEVKIKNFGFTNKTQPKANNPIILQNFMDVWCGHVNDMSMYHAFVLPLEDFNRIFNYNSPKQEGQPSVSVKGTIQSAYSPAAVSYVKNLITDLNGGARSDPTAGIINRMTGLFKKGAVFASMSVVVQQLSAIARAAALVDTQYFFGRKIDAKKRSEIWKEIKTYAPVAIIKEMGYFDTNIGQSTHDYIQGRVYSGIGEKAKALFTDSNYRDEMLSRLPALADEMAWCSIWEAVKRETKAKKPNMGTDSEVFLKKAGTRFTEVITKTQVYDSVLSRSAFMRSKDTGMKAATAFMAEPTTSINMIADALIKGKRGDRRYARTAIGAVLASQLLNSILVSVVYAARDDDEDQTFDEKYVESLVAELKDSINPAGYIPFIKDIQSIAKGYTVERSDMAVISDLWEAWQSLGSDNLSGYKKVEKFAGSIAQLFGLPLKNIMRDIRAVWQVIEGFYDDEKSTSAGLGYAVRQGWTGETISNQQQLYDAMLKGDQEQINRVKARYKDDSAINSAIRKALRENDSRIREAAISWNENNLAAYMRIAKEIIGEKHFSQDDIVMAIRAEAEKLSPEESTGGISRTQGLFNAEKFSEAIAQGNQSMANAIRADMIRTAQSNGKTNKEAEKSFISSAKTALKDMYLEGKLSEAKVRSTLTAYCGVSQEEADNTIRIYKWMRQNPKYDLTEAEVGAYINPIENIGISVEASGIKPDLFMDYRGRRSNCKGTDLDGDGVTDRNSVKNQIMEVINNLPITSEQKDVLYYLNGWAESKLWQAPWHK